MDNLQQVGKDLGQIKVNTATALRREYPKRPAVERARDIFDSLVPFEMEFEVDVPHGTITLDLVFSRPPDNDCCASCICSICEIYTSGFIFTTTYAYASNSVRVIRVINSTTQEEEVLDLIDFVKYGDDQAPDFPLTDHDIGVFTSATPSNPYKVCYAYIVEGCSGEPIVVPLPPGNPLPAPLPDPGTGTILNKNFEDGILYPFRILTYPNEHPGDLMVQYGLFYADMVSVHDGYLDLRCVRQPDNTWRMSFVGTGRDGHGGEATFKFQYGISSVKARMNYGPGAWQGLWYLIADAWSAPEIDWPEMIGQHYTANLHGSSSDGQYASELPFDSSEWHIYTMVKDPSYIAFEIDGVEVGRANVAMSANMGLLADAKVGLSAPNSTTPSPLYIHVAWWTVDPL